MRNIVRLVIFPHLGRHKDMVFAALLTIVLVTIVHVLREGPSRHMSPHSHLYAYRRSCPVSKEDPAGQVGLRGRRQSCLGFEA